MATRHFLFGIGSAVDSSNRSGFLDLDLNQNYKCVNVSTKYSTTGSKKRYGYGSNDELDDRKIRFDKAKLTTKTWKKSTNSLFSFNYNEDIPHKCKNGDCSVRGSTLSLHIAGYENLDEADASEMFVDKNYEQSHGLKKHIFEEFIAVNKNPFEFLRQQDMEIRVPEKMKFSTSTKLLSVNGPNVINNTQSNQQQQQQQQQSTTVVPQRRRRALIQSHPAGADEDMSMEPSYAAKRGISKQYKPNAILIYYDQNGNGFTFQQKSTYKWICIKCEREYNRTKDFKLATYHVEEDCFKVNPTENHHCNFVSKEHVEAEQLYRIALAEIAASGVDSGKAYEILMEKFEEKFGERAKERLLIELPNRKNLKHVLNACSKRRIKEDKENEKDKTEADADAEGGGEENDEVEAETETETEAESDEDEVEEEEEENESDEIVAYRLRNGRKVRYSK